MQDNKNLLLVAVLTTALVLAGCNGTSNQSSNDGQGKLFGGLNALLFGDDEEKVPTVGVYENVNSFLWQASLDLLNEVALEIHDPDRGLIQTEWINFSEFPNERFKIRIQVIGRALSTQALRVSTLKQVFEQQRWLDVEIDAQQQLNAKIYAAIFENSRAAYIANQLLAS